MLGVCGQSCGPDAQRFMPIDLLSRGIGHVLTTSVKVSAVNAEACIKATIYEKHQICHIEDFEIR